MDFVNQHLVSLIVFTPLIGLALVGLIPADQKGAIKWTALIASLVPAGLSIYLWALYADSGSADIKFFEEAVWYAPINTDGTVGTWTQTSTVPVKPAGRVRVSLVPVLPPSAPAVVLQA